MKSRFYPFTALSMEKLIDVTKIITIHYFEYMKDFSFPGEKHDFWEILCVDKGELDVFNGKEWIIMEKGSLIFHQPNEFHGLKANGIVAPNVVVISFDCSSPAMDFFKEKKFFYTAKEREYLANVILNARAVFVTALDNPYFKKMERRNDICPGAEQLITLNLELLLLSLYRTHNPDAQKLSTSPKELDKKLYSYPRETYSREIADKVVAFTSENLNKPLSISDICEATNVSYSAMKKLFLHYFGCSPHSYFNALKIEKAKELIRCSAMNVSELSLFLGYSSIHYFSRQFKKVTGMSPTEYATSIKAKSEPSESVII